MRAKPILAVYPKIRELARFAISNNTVYKNIKTIKGATDETDETDEEGESYP